MFLLDTNVISEMMKPEPDQQVMRWVDQQDPNVMYISSITIAEITYGIAALPSGLRRKSLERMFNQTIAEAFAYRVLFFDDAAAFAYGHIMSHRKQLGKPMSILDGQISAIASIHGLSVVTRNIRDFMDCAINMINPFEPI